MNTESPGVEIIAGAPVYARDGEGTMVSLPYRRRSENGEVTLLGVVNLRFNIVLPEPAPSGNATLPLGLLVAMAAGLPLRMEAPVSPLLLENCDRFQEIHQSFFPDETIVPIRAEAAAVTQARPALGVGSFLSNGVDSLHTILARLDEITHFIFIIGFDIWLKHSEYAARSLAQARETAAKLGRPLIVVETNAFDFAHHYIPWPRDGHPLQAGIGFLLSPLLGKIIQALDFSYRRFEVSAEHPHLYEALCSEDFHIQPSCGKYTRQQKVRRLCQSPEWLPHLRVCWDMPEDRLNCGKCEKCLRTMIGLSIEGASALCPVLPELKPEAVAQLTYASKSSSFYFDMLREAEVSPHVSPELLRALRACVHRHQLEDLARKMLPLRHQLTGTRRYQQYEKKLRDPLFSLLQRIDEVWFWKKLRRHAGDFREDIRKVLRKSHKPLLKQGLRHAWLARAKSLFRRKSS